MWKTVEYICSHCDFAGRLTCYILFIASRLAKLIGLMIDSTILNPHSSSTFVHHKAKRERLWKDCLL